MPTGLFTRYEFDADFQKVKPRQNKSRSFENMVMLSFQQMRPDCGSEVFYTPGTQKKIDCFNAVGFCAHCNTVFEAMGCFYLYCPCEEARSALTEEDLQRGTKKGNWMKCGDSVLRSKVTFSSKCGNVNGVNSTILMCQLRNT